MDAKCPNCGSTKNLWISEHGKLICDNCTPLFEDSCDDDCDCDECCGDSDPYWDDDDDYDEEEEDDEDLLLATL